MPKPGFEVLLNLSFLSEFVARNVKECNSGYDNISHDEGCDCYDCDYNCEECDNS